MANTTTAEGADQELHVHFDDTVPLKDEFETENSVTYQKSGDNTIIVHLGFLQVHHRYHIDLKLPAHWFKSSAEPLLVPATEDESNLHCTLVDFHFSEEKQLSKETNKEVTQRYYNIKVEYYAYDDKLLKESLKLVNSKNLEDILKLVITARVLGSGKGTPLLRNGIHCIATPDDDSSEVGATASGSSQ